MKQPLPASCSVTRIRSIRDRTALDAFIAQHLTPAKHSLQMRFSVAFTELNERSLQKYRMRYILGKFTQSVNEHAWGSNHENINLATFIGSGVEVEHILPQTPTDAVIAAFDRPELMADYIRRIGNLTLLEKTINCAVGNGLFTDKITAYRQSKFLITKTLAEPVSVGVNTAVNRAVSDLEAFTTWDSHAIERRQAMLTRLANKVWDMT